MEQDTTFRSIQMPRTSHPQVTWPNKRPKRLALVSGTDLKQRLVAILAADAAGYSRLMSSDERATVATLDASRAVFHTRTVANQGRVVDTAGDSVLAVFETAAGALTAAIQIQAELAELARNTAMERRMQFRIGIHSGDVMEKADGSVYGDGVNIAARLQALAEPGQITVSDAIHGAVRGKVSATFSDQGEQTVKNIAHPIRAYRVLAESGGGEVPVATQSMPAADVDLSLPDKPSIAVLPFTNMSGDPEQEYFTDGISEDIITELSRFQSLFVIARNSSFTYKGKAVDIKQVGRELGVRYVLEGSIRKAGNRIRVTAQLIDSVTGSHIWAEKYDRALEDIFAVQEEVTECIVGAIAPHVNAAELLKARRRPGNLSAYELAVRAQALGVESQQNSSLEARNEALRLARAALALDPDSVGALCVIAHAQWLHVIWHTTTDRQAAWRDGMDAIERAIAVQGLSVAHALRAILLAFAPGGGRWAEAGIEADRAWRLNPQDYQTLTPCGYVLSNAGNPVEGIRLLERALRINPRDPHAFFIYGNLASAHLATREYAKGLEWARRALSAAPNNSEAILYMAALHVGQGDIDQARAAMDHVRRLAPASVQHLGGARSDGGKSASRKDDDAGAVARQRMKVFLRIAAGLEDPSAADALR